MKVGDVMTRDVTSVTPETALRDVAQLLGEKRISGVPVVDARGKCLGIVSEAEGPDLELLRRIAEVGGGRAFVARDGSGGERASADDAWAWSPLT